MAVKLRRAEPLRVVSVTTDDGLDEQAMDIDDYLRTRDPRLVRERPGAQVTWWTLRPLPTSVAATFEGREGRLGDVLALSFALTDCSDPALRSELEWEGTGEARRLVQRSVDKLPLELVKELGTLALEMASLTQGEGRRFAAPDGWQSTRRLLGVSSATSATRSEATPPEQSC